MTRLIYVTHPEVQIVPSLPVDTWLISNEGWKRVDHFVKSPAWKDVNVIYSSTEPKALRKIRKKEQKKGKKNREKKKNGQALKRIQRNESSRN